MPEHSPGPRSLDFSPDGRYPAIVDIILGSGYRFTISASDEEAKRIITQLSEWVVAEEAQEPA